MNAAKKVRRGHIACRRDGIIAIIGAAVAAMMLVFLLAGCGSSTPPATETPAPAPAAASIGPLWAQVGAAETPLFSLIVTESQGFSAAEQKYLRGLKVTWSTISQEATEYAALAESSADPAALATLAGRIGRQAEAAASRPSPSARFSVLHESARLLMRRVVRLSLLTQTFVNATTEEQKGAIAAQLTGLATPLAGETLRVADWGIELRNRYGGLSLAAAWSVPATTTPASSSTSAPQPTPNPAPQPTPNPAPNPNSKPTAKPTAKPTPKPTRTPTITAAEARQISEIAELDSWLTAVLDQTNSTLKDQTMPWSDDLVASFCLNMSFLQDKCDQWLGTPAAGRLMAASYKEYLKGLSLVRQGARQLTAAAQRNTAGAGAGGAATLGQATPYLQQGMARLGALR